MESDCVTCQLAAIDEPAQIRASNVNMRFMRIRLVKSADDGMLTGSADAATGQALIQPLAKDPFGVFVFSQSGKTYTLVLQPQDIPGETIVIKETAVRASVAAKPGEIERASSYQQAIKKMIQALAGEGLPEGLVVKKTWE